MASITVSTKDQGPSAPTFARPLSYMTLVRFLLFWVSDSLKKCENWLNWGHQTKPIGKLKLYLVALQGSCDNLLCFEVI